jgi:hypothetical protein
MAEARGSLGPADQGGIGGGRRNVPYYESGDDPSLGLLPEYTSDMRIPGAKVPRANENLSRILNTQMQQARDYRARIPQMSDSLYNTAAGASSRQLAETLKGVRSDYNARGLYSSGRRLGAESSEKAGAAGRLADTRSSINQGLLSNADAMENNAFNTAGNIAGMGAGLGTAALSGVKTGIENDIASSQAQQSIFGGLGQGLGSLAGSIVARRNTTGGGSSGSGSSAGNSYYNGAYT